MRPCEGMMSRYGFSPCSICDAASKLCESSNRSACGSPSAASRLTALRYAYEASG